jgi:WD40 repeat protein
VWGRSRTIDATWREIAVLRGHQRELWSAAFSPDGGRVVTASGDGTAREWDAASGQELAVLRGHRSGVRSAAFSADGARVVTASFDGTARVWGRSAMSASTWRELMTLRGHEGGVQDAAFSPDGNGLVTASTDGTARVWDVVSGRELAVLRAHAGSVWSAAFSTDGARVVITSDDGTTVWTLHPVLFESRRALLERACNSVLAGDRDDPHRLSLLRPEELAAAPVLDRRLDADVCAQPSLWARLGAALGLYRPPEMVAETQPEADRAGEADGER